MLAMHSDSSPNESTFSDALAQYAFFKAVGAVAWWCGLFCDLLSIYVHLLVPDTADANTQSNADR